MTIERLELLVFSETAGRLVSGKGSEGQNRRKWSLQPDKTGDVESPLAAARPAEKSVAQSGHFDKLIEFIGSQICAAQDAHVIERWIWEPA
jgi:hypothetical protein